MRAHEGWRRSGQRIVDGLDGLGGRGELGRRWLHDLQQLARKRQVADARGQRIASLVRTFVRSVVAIVVIGPFRLLRSLLSTSGGVAVEMLPPARRDPAKVRVSALTRDPEFAKAAERFTTTADGATPIAGQHEESRGAKAA